MAVDPISAIIAPVPEVDALTRRWRRRHDPSGRAGAVAHVTLLVPFITPDLIDDGVVRDLARVLHPFFPCEVTFRRAARFSDTVYLAPHPDEPFRAMTRALVARWPEHLPYQGAHLDPTPHLTVAHGSDEGVLAAVNAEVEHILPVVAHIREVHLIVGCNEGGWSLRARVPLGA